MTGLLDRLVQRVVGAVPQLPASSANQADFDEVHLNVAAETSAEPNVDGGLDPARPAMVAASNDMAHPNPAVHLESSIGDLEASAPQTSGTLDAPTEQRISAMPEQVSIDPDRRSDVPLDPLQKQSEVRAHRPIVHATERMVEGSDPAQPRRTAVSPVEIKAARTVPNEVLESLAIEPGWETAPDSPEPVIGSSTPDHIIGIKPSSPPPTVAGPAIGVKPSNPPPSLAGPEMMAASALRVGEALTAPAPEGGTELVTANDLADITVTIGRIELTTTRPAAIVPSPPAAAAPPAAPHLTLADYMARATRRG